MKDLNLNLSKFIPKEIIYSITHIYQRLFKNTINYDDDTFIKLITILNVDIDKLKIHRNKEISIIY